jgi:hypothetical protein
MSNSETVLSPALTATSLRPSSLTTTAPCEPSAAPEQPPPLHSFPEG